MKITINTSGTTGQMKFVEHEEKNFYKPAEFLCQKWNLTSSDIILNPFPSWTVANWAFCYYPAKISSCELVNINFKPFTFWDLVNEIRPTILTMAIGTIRTLFKLKIPQLTYVRNFSTGSSRIYEKDIFDMKKTKAQNIWNIYGSSECIPPVLMSKNQFFYDTESVYDVSILNEKIIVNNSNTQDIMKNNEILEREIKNKTWKN